jgi:hypothetical protein
MAYKTIKSCLILSPLILAVVWATNNKPASVSGRLPPIETFLIEPIDLENIDVWVPAEKTGPVINRSCQPKKNCSFSCLLPASVEHSKTESCPDELARLLAEHTAHYHEKSLPLTIFNGWQWEYSYSMSQFELVSYDLPRRGGCWENSWEAILTQTVGSVGSQWLKLASPKEVLAKHNNGRGSTIKVKTFNDMRTRNGYPKERQLQN